MDQESGRKLNRLSTHEHVALTLRNAIINGEFAFGAQLNEKALSESLGVSRTPVREAFIDLQGQALIEIIPYRGAFVFDMDEVEFEELGNYRAVLEAAAIRAAASHDRKGLSGELHNMLKEMRRSVADKNGRAYGELDTAFHETILKKSENRFLKDGYERVGARLSALRNRIQHDAKTVEGSLEKHEMIVAAIDKGQIDEAVALMETHISNGMKFFCRRIEQFRAIARSA